MKTEGLALTGARLSPDVRLICDSCDQRATHRLNGRLYCVLHALEYIFGKARDFAIALGFTIRQTVFDQVEQEPGEGSSKRLSEL